MGLTHSLYTGLSGLNANSQLISVAGNNIANVNTNAFKASRADFQTEISESLGRGSGPTGELGGTNPTQIGLGTQLGSITRNFRDGSLQPTGVNTEMAIEGNGFFIVNRGGTTHYTRAGAFKLDSDFNLVNADGGLVQGYAVDDNYSLIKGATRNMNIPLGNRSLTKPTENVRFSGNLNANGVTATDGSITSSAAVFSDAGATTQAVGTDALSGLFDASGAALFADGDVITISGAGKGGATLPDATFQVGAANTTGSDDNGTTLDDFAAFVQDVLGIDTSVTGGTAGVSIVGGGLRVEGNPGTVNDISLGDANIVKNRDTNPTTPFDLAKTQDANGESVRTTFVGYDSIGTPMNLDLSVVLEDKGAAGTTWRFYAQSQDDTDVSRVLGTGTLTFDTDGQLNTVTGNDLSIDRAGSGAASPQAISLKFNEPAGALSALTDVNSQIAALSQDGTPRGVLDDFSVSSDGTIVGVFSNSQTRVLGQVVLATFANPAGLSEIGNSLYGVTASSGDATVLAAGEGNAGSIVGGALELSNVDLSQEFINLITASTGFSANSRVLTTSDRLIQDLLSTLRG